MSTKTQNSTFEFRNDSRRYTSVLLLFAACCALICAGCGKKQSTAPPPSIADLMSQAWASFVQGDFSTAESKFDQVLSQNGSYVDALNGKGWCRGIFSDLPGAMAAFRSGQSASATNNSIRSGLAFTFSALDSPDSALTYGGLVLVTDSLWQLGHRYIASVDDTLNYRDLRILMAENHYKRGQFQLALDQLKKLDPTISIGTDFTQPENQAALLAEIERLSMRYK